MYIIEGNIGAGKTTFLNIIGQSFPHIKIVDEPLDIWDSKKHGQSLLSFFYQDTPRWAFTMEMFTIMCRVREHIKEQQDFGRPIVMERSIYSGYYCFALNSFRQGFMNRMEWEIYKRWFNYMVKGKCSLPNGFIYLKTSPDIAHERTAKRNREGEETIPLSYFKQINERLEDFLIHKKDVAPEHKDIPILVLDCDQEFEHNKGRKNLLLSSIIQFFDDTQKFQPAYLQNPFTKEKGGYF